MYYVDILLAIPLIWGAFMGFKKGLVLELASIFALALGTYGSIKFSGLTAIYLREEMAWETNWLGIIAFLITFMGIVILVFLLGKLLDKMLKVVALGLVNRLLGLLFGVLKYALLLSVLLFFFDNLNAQFHFTKENWKESSILFQPLQYILEPLSPLLNEISLSKLDSSLPELP